jgi:hypothetical protein
MRTLSRHFTRVAAGVLAILFSNTGAGPTIVLDRGLKPIAFTAETPLVPPGHHMPGQAAPAEAEIEEWQRRELEFADNLASCTNARATFGHPLTGDTLTKEILGIVNGKCHYVEPVPGGFTMECRYTESERRAAAQYHKDVATAMFAGTSLF